MCIEDVCVSVWAFVCLSIDLCSCVCTIGRVGVQWQCLQAPPGVRISEQVERTGGAVF